MYRKTKEIYSEVYSILNMLGEEYITKIPIKLYQMIKEEKSNEYNPKYDFEKELGQQGIKKETLTMIALFHLNYWCNSQEEKQELLNLFSENEIKYQTELIDKYKPDDIFKNIRHSTQNVENTENESVALIEHKENKFRRVINKILDFFKLRKHVNKS